jgi:hypothetical protein
MADPYAAQLAGFTASIPNARRGLIDLYKTRRKGIERHYNSLGDLYGGAAATSSRQYAGSRAALGGFADQGMDMAAQSGYDLSSPDTRAAVAGIISEGTSPFNAFLKTEGAAQGALYRGLKGAEKYEDKTLKTGLAREQPAALSELEQGIIDTQTNLQGQSSAYQAQNQMQQQMQGYMQQMLQYQGQQATMAQGGGMAGGGLSPAEQWIIGKESSNNVYADNPTSSAYGLGQLLLGNRQQYGRQLGFDPNTNDYGEQLAMMRAYIKDRYGSAQAAQAFWQAHGWY